MWRRLLISNILQFLGMTTKKESIEERLKKLNDIIKKFESGKLGLESGVEEFKKGKKLVGDIRKELESIELSINEIKNNL